MVNLEEKNMDFEALAREALDNEDLFSELKKGVLSKDNNIRQNSFKALQFMAEEYPEFLYPEWDFFQEMLYSPNNFHKYIAIYILASLTSVDKNNRFEEIFDDYYGILAGDKAMNASHVALNSSVIAHNKPKLRSRIVDTLLRIDEIHQGKQKELIKAYAIEALGKIYPESEDKELIENFIKSQVDSKSPKTRTMAQCFLDRCV
ncbi:hypothetical protein MBMB1_0714 [Methanobacterium sp. MB1]|jgi:hypothetical protein|uniref:hypothetical protein n=1 Tax=Methanobacterium sp. TaxID=2164 RepID=UPI0003C99BB3|nr:hypothetical protein [Methanobacterium sp.]CDG64818.1 hypothetical protein MBMB1_0714 [Methanobacterium sp. MB1]